MEYHSLAHNQVLVYEGAVDLPMNISSLEILPIPAQESVILKEFADSNFFLDYFECSK